MCVCIKNRISCPFRMMAEICHLALHVKCMWKCIENWKPEMMDDFGSISTDFWDAPL